MDRTGRRRGLRPDGREVRDTIAAYRLSERAYVVARRLATKIVDAKRYGTTRVKGYSREQQVERNVEMVVGEMALSRHYGLPPYSGRVYEATGDGGFDLVALDGTLANVKTSSHPNPRLLVRQEETSEPAELYVLARWIPSMREVHLLGEASLDVVLSYPVQRVRENGPLNHVLTIDDLDPVEKRRG